MVSQPIYREREGPPLDLPVEEGYWCPKDELASPAYYSDGNIGSLTRAGLLTRGARGPALLLRLGRSARHLSKTSSIRVKAVPGFVRALEPRLAKLSKQQYLRIP